MTVLLTVIASAIIFPLFGGQEFRCHTCTADLQFGESQYNKPCIDQFSDDDLKECVWPKRCISSVNFIVRNTTDLSIWVSRRCTGHDFALAEHQVAIHGCFDKLFDTGFRCRRFCSTDGCNTHYLRDNIGDYLRQTGFNLSCPWRVCHWSAEEPPGTGQEFRCHTCTAHLQFGNSQYNRPCIDQFSDDDLKECQKPKRCISSVNTIVRNTTDLYIYVSRRCTGRDFAQAEHQVAIHGCFDKLFDTGFRCRRFCSTDRCNTHGLRDNIGDYLRQTGFNLSCPWRVCHWSDEDPPGKGILTTKPPTTVITHSQTIYGALITRPPNNIIWDKLPQMGGHRFTYW